MGAILVPIAVPWICRIRIRYSSRLCQLIRLGLLVGVVHVVDTCLGYLVKSIVHFVYHHHVGCWCIMSIDASMHFWGNFVVSISFRNSVVSFRYEAGALLAVNK